MSPKDLIVLQLYLIFMDIEVDGEDNIYKTMITMMQEQGSQERFDPDQSFQFNSVNTDKIKELLIGLNQERFLNSEVSKLIIFDVFTNVIIEALQFLGFIPYAIEQDIEEVQTTFNMSTEMKEHYFRLSKIVYK